MTLREFIIKEGCGEKCCAKDFDDEEKFEGEEKELKDDSDKKEKKSKKHSKKDEDEEDVCPECGKKFSECECC